MNPEFPTVSLIASTESPVEGEMRLRGGVDTGATTSLVSATIAEKLGLRVSPTGVRLFDVEGRKLSVQGSAVVKVRLVGPGSSRRVVEIPVIVVRRLEIANVDLLLGATAHNRLGSKLVFDTKHGGVSYVAAVQCGDAPDSSASDSGYDHENSPAATPRSESPKTVRWATPLLKEEQEVEVDQDNVPQPPASTTDVVIEDPDFVIERREAASLDGPEQAESQGQRYGWVVRWRWKTGVDPARISSSGVERYRKSWWTEAHEKQFREETNEWVRLGFLVPACSSGCKFIPWSCTSTPGKSTPLRLALDFVPTNEFVKNRAEWSQREVCSDELLRWRTSDGGELLDVKKAYMRIHVDRSLWPYQSVRVDGVPYHLTRLAFGLCSAPRILKKVLDYVLKGLPVATFRDDVFIPKEVLTAELRAEVIRRLNLNGFPVKPPQVIGGEETCKVLGLRVNRVGDEIEWSRKDPLSVDAFRNETKLRGIASAVGQLCATSYPVLGWSRPLSNAIRSAVGKEAAAAAGDWSVEASDELQGLYRLLVERLKSDDPVRGVWRIEKNASWRLWTDASKFAAGYVIEADGKAVEDFTQTSSTRQSKLHINVRELDAVVLALSRLYQIKSQIAPKIPTKVEICCDNKSVVSWIRSLLQDDPIRLVTMSYVLIESRLEIIREALEQLNADVKITWVASSQNIADCLTRIPLEEKRGSIGAVGPTSDDLPETIKKLHKELLHKGPEILVAELRKRRVNWSGTDIRREALAACRECRQSGPCMFKSPVMVTRSRSIGRCHEAEMPGSEVFIDFLKVDQGEQTRFWGAFNLIDAYSRKVMTLLSTGAPTKELARVAIMQWISVNGPIGVLRCDRGREFSNILADGAPLLVGSQRMGAVLHPESQSTIERCHRELLSCIRMMAVDDRRVPWHERYLESVRVWNTRPHKVLGWNSPHEVWAGASVPVDVDDDEESDEVPELGRLQIEELVRFREGDHVLWKGHGRRKDVYPWEQGIIKEVLPRGAYRVEFKRGSQNSTTVRVVNEDRLALGATTAPDTIETIEQPLEEDSVPSPRRSARIAGRNREHEAESLS